MRGEGVICAPWPACDPAISDLSAPLARPACQHLRERAPAWCERRHWVQWGRKSPPVSRPLASFFKYFLWFPDVNEGKVHGSQTSAWCCGLAGLEEEEAGGRALGLKTKGPVGRRGHGPLVCRSPGRCCSAGPSGVPGRACHS